MKDGRKLNIAVPWELNQLLRAAQDYASIGWEVFPLSPGTKIPLPGSGGFKDATIDEDQIRQWWSDHPDANIGIALEASALAVIDPDRHPGKLDGVEALNRLEAEYGPLPKTPVVETPSGGLHLYFVDEQKIKTTSLAESVDLKAVGGYVVAPPSVYNGVPYRWADMFRPTDLDPPPLPQWVRDLAATQGRNGTRPVPDTPPATDGELRKGSLWLKAWIEQRGRPWFEAHGINLMGPSAWDHADRIRYEFTPCPWNAEHQDRAAWLGINDHGAVVAGCHHTSCPEDTSNWSTLRVLVEGERFALTDLGNCERLVRRHGEDLLFVHDWGLWFAWDGRRFKPDETGEVIRLAKSTVRSIYEEATREPDDDHRKVIARRATQSESALKIKAMVDLARSEFDVAAIHTELDRNPLLFNCANGTLNLKTGELLLHDRAFRLTKLSHVPYIPDAACPQFDAFLLRIMDGNDDLIDFLQRAIGYSMTGLTVEQVLFFCYGTGANGKSTLIETLFDLFGDYAQKAPTSMITLTGRDSDGVPNDLARLPGARLAVAAEVEEGRRMKESRIKDLTGGDTMVARFMRAEFFEFIPTHKLWIYGNHKPTIRGTDEAIWRRIPTLPFTVRIPEEERDPFLKDKLKTELPGILAWCVKGARNYFEQGLCPPTEVLAATAEYRSEMDVVGQFVEEELVLTPTAKTLKGEIYDAFKLWAERSGEYVISKKAFAMKMKDRGTRERKGRKHFWLGIELATDAIDSS